ncbi:hypothetical protein GLYMA_07G254150v4 [Glycine max]|nr:hypothetical protein GLYMA_07G254150v4 [Glycine max]KAH1088582.1 hypothetical protein GYH30_019561 [Glycine max]
MIVCKFVFCLYFLCIAETFHQTNEIIDVYNIPSSLPLVIFRLYL